MTSPIHHRAGLSFLALLLVGFSMTIPLCKGRRYRRCMDGCCIHEYCAYGLICYPRIHCHFGCPDGYCTGSGEAHPDSSKHSQQQRQTVRSSSAPTKRNVRRPRNGNASQITENYSHSDTFERPSPSAGGGQKPEGIPTGSAQNIPEGICMPLPPCVKSDACSRLGHSCSYNFNLGYSVCQYNLEIGTTLCYDTQGNYVTKPQH